MDTFNINHEKNRDVRDVGLQKISQNLLDNKTGNYKQGERIQEKRATFNNVPTFSSEALKLIC